jgi:pseudouridine synthase
MDSLILLNKPMNMLSQFSDDGAKRGLAHLLKAPHYRVAGRLDSDSEGLLVLTTNGKLQSHLTSPNQTTWKYYWVQVEGEITHSAIEQLTTGLLLNDGLTLPAKVTTITAPVLWDREPPIRYRAQVPTCWLSIGLCEGRNRQIRRMTAAVGFPTLRLVRYQVGAFKLASLMPGEYRFVEIPPSFSSATATATKKRRGYVSKVSPTARVRS